MGARECRVPLRASRRTRSACTMIFPSYGGIYVPCQVLRSIVQVRKGPRGPEYIFRSAISFLPMENDQQVPLHEFLTIQMERLRGAEARR